jgi:hypothetical protein
MESFGFFGSSSDSNKYFENVNAENIMPQAEDFIDIPFRLLTATTVGAGSWKATDFSNARVLKASKSKLNNKPVYKDHDTDLDNWVGIVKTTKWTEEQTQGGVKIPAGIDAVLSIDAKTNPKIARGVLIGAIHSNSVTVVFDWKPSHDFEEDWQFRDRVGTMHEDGEMIRRVVTKIYDYHETSLVWLGADPFSKLLDDKGNLVNIDKSSIQYDKVGDDERSRYEEKNEYKVSFGLNEKVLSLAKDNFSRTRQQQKLPDMNEKMLAALRVILGLSEDAEVTVEMLDKLQLTPDKPVVPITEEQTNKVERFDALSGSEIVLAEVEEGAEPISLAADTELAEDAKFAIVQREKFDALVAEADKVTQLTKDNEELKADAQLGKEYIGMKKEEAIRLYKVAQGDKADDKVVALFEKADAEQLDGLLKQYTQGVTAKFSGKCEECGSTNFSFKSTISGEAETSGDEEVKATSFDEIYNQRSAGKLNIHSHS